MDDSMFAVGTIDAQYGSTQRGLKSRHAQMIALGGSIGTAYDKIFFPFLMHIGLTKPVCSLEVAPYLPLVALLLFLRDTPSLL